MTKQSRATCPICLETVALKQDEAFRRHNRGWGRGNYWCPGSGRVLDSGPCDSCGEVVAMTVTMFKPDERYDHGYAHGIGPCCIPRFERAGYTVVKAEQEAIWAS